MRVAFDIVKISLARGEYMRKWRNRSRRYIMLSGAKQRARKRNIDFSLRLEDIPEIPDTCPILGIPLKVNEGTPGWYDNSPSLDRVVNSRGYIKDNIRIISNRANRIKMDATLEELEKILVDARSL